ncbi:MAG: type II secretion system secretin GspD [Lysobacteraceae bacterium]
MRHLIAPVAVALLVVLAGCATRPTSPSAITLPPLEGSTTTPVAQGVYGEELDLGGEPVPVADPLGDLTRSGSGVLINEDAARRPLGRQGATGDVSFNFEGESLHAVVKLILGEFLQQNYVIAPGVQGTVTFSTAKPLREDQALSILEMLLRWNNAALIWQDGRYTVLPVAQALPGNLTPRMGPAQTVRGYEVRAVPLRYISASEMEKLLKPYAKPESIIHVDTQRNLLTLAGTRAELENYLQTVEVFDVDWLAGMSVGVFTLQQAEASKVIGEMEKLFGEGGNTPLAGMFRFLALEGINGILVITPQPNYLATIQEWLERFDLGGGEAGQRLYVFDVKNVKAQDLADTLSDIFGSSGSRSSSAARPGGVAPGLEPVEISTVGSQNAASVAREARREQQAARRAAASGGGDGIALGATDEVKISAVEESNALIVRATSSQWESVRRVIERLDQVPLQVAIETQIVRVALNETLSYGVQWFFENSVPEALREQAAAARGWRDIAGSIGPVSDGSGGMSWNFIGPNANAVISALDSVSDVTILSAPLLVVLNNKEGSINVGTQLPVVSTYVNSGVIGGDSSYSSVQFRQVGIKLNVTPRVNPGGLVFLEIEQEESEPGAGDPVGGNIPVDNRTITTEVAVQSGNTVMLGGLIKQTENTGGSGFPFLSRIPVLGALFGRQSQQATREELIVLITPRVIHNADDARRITEDYQRKFRGLKPLRPSAAEAEAQAY